MSLKNTINTVNVSMLLRHHENRLQPILYLYQHVIYLPTDTMEPYSASSFADTSAEYQATTVCFLDNK